MELESGQQPNRALRGPPAPWFDHPASWFLLLCASFAGLVLLAPYFENLAGPARLAAWFVGLLAVALFARRAFSKGAAGRARAMSAADAAVGRLPGLGESGDRKDIEEQLRRLVQRHCWKPPRAASPPVSSPPQTQLVADRMADHGRFISTRPQTRRSCFRAASVCRASRNVRNLPALQVLTGQLGNIIFCMPPAVN